MLHNKNDDDNNNDNNNNNNINNNNNDNYGNNDYDNDDKIVICIVLFQFICSLLKRLRWKGLSYILQNLSCSIVCKRKIVFYLHI